MWFIRGLFLLGALGSAAWGLSNMELIVDWADIHEAPHRQEVIALRADGNAATLAATTGDADTRDAVAPAPILRAPAVDDPMAGGEVRAALSNLLLADPIEYSVAATAVGEDIGSEVVRDGWWEPSTGHGGLTTDIELTHTFRRVEPFGQAAAALGDDTTIESTRTVTLTVLVNDDGVTIDTDGSGPEAVPDDLAEELSTSLNPVPLLVSPLLRELGSVERIDSGDGPGDGSTRSYRASFAGDALAGLGVGQSLMDRLEGAGFDGRTGVDVPAMILIADDGSLTIDIDLSSWWAAALTEAPTVPPTTQTVRLILNPGGGPRA